MHAAQHNPEVATWLRTWYAGRGLAAGTSIELGETVRRALTSRQLSAEQIDAAVAAEFEGFGHYLSTAPAVEIPTDICLVRGSERSWARAVRTVITPGKSSSTA